MSEPKKKKLKIDLGALHDKMAREMTKERKEHKAAGKRFAPEKGEYVEDVDPKDADRHLED